MTRPKEQDYASQTAYCRALEIYCDEVINEIRAELAKPEQEPVAWLFPLDTPVGQRLQISYIPRVNPESFPVYRAPVEFGCTSNCDTCRHAWGSPANPGYCYMFYTEPQGVCAKWDDGKQLCKWPTCKNEEYQKTLAVEVADQIFGKELPDWSAA